MIQFLKLLRCCDHRTIKRFVVTNSQQGLKKCAANKKTQINWFNLRRMKCVATRNPLSSSSVRFNNCILPRKPRGSEFRDLAKVRKAELVSWGVQVGSRHIWRRILQRFYGWNESVGGSVTNTKLHSESETSAGFLKTLSCSSACLHLSTRPWFVCRVMLHPVRINDHFSLWWFHRDGRHLVSLELKLSNREDAQPGNRDGAL